MVLNLGCVLGENSVSRFHPGPTEGDFLRVQSEHHLKVSEPPHFRSYWSNLNLIPRIVGH